MNESGEFEVKEEDDEMEVLDEEKINLNENSRRSIRNRNQQILSAKSPKMKSAAKSNSYFSLRSFTQPERSVKRVDFSLSKDETVRVLD